MVWVDAHCHLADDRFADDLPDLIRRSRRAGIGVWIQGGVGPADWERQTHLDFDGIVPAFGIHPWWVAIHEDSACDVALARLPSFLERPGSAFGELGLDFFDKAQRHTFPRMRRLFQAQLEINQDLRKPLVLHLVKCGMEGIQMLKKSGTGMRGLVHGFTGSREMADRYLELGFTISVGPAVCKNGFRKLKEAVFHIPDDRLVIESDAPDQVIPDPVIADPVDAQKHYHLTRTDRNEPISILSVAARVAAIRQCRVADLLAQSAQNLRKLFALEDRP